MTPVSATRPEPTVRAHHRQAPTRDTEQRFEDALTRNTSQGRDADTAKGIQEKTPNEPAAGPMLLGQFGHGRDEGDQRRASRGLDEISRPETNGPAHSTQASAPVKSDVTPAQPVSTMLPTSHAEMALRMALPQAVQGAETSVLMTDPRSIASQAVVVQDSAGTMSLDIGAGQDGSSEQQRQELKARLEARGHRIASIRIHPVDR
jgi:hypothetical protein